MPGGSSGVGAVTGGLSDWLWGFTGDLVELGPGVDQVPALLDESDQQVTRVGAAEFLTPGGKRAILGLPPLAEGL